MDPMGIDSGGCFRMCFYIVVKQLKAKMRAMLTEELLRLGTAQARAAEEQAHHRPWGIPGRCWLRVKVLARVC